LGYVCACFFSVQNGVESLLDGAVGRLQVRGSLISLGINIVSAGKARAKGQKYEYCGNEKFEVVAYFFVASKPIVTSYWYGKLLKDEKRNL
jgi:hypothetical protein